MRLLITSLIIFILGIFNVFAPIRGGVQFLFNPVQYGLQQSAYNVKGVTDFFSNIVNIRNENLKLSAKIEELNSQIVELNELQEENTLLREQLNVAATQDLDKGLILARVLGGTKEPNTVGITLSRGSLHGINIGDLVVKGNILVGIVRSVSHQRSEVEILTSPSLKVGVTDTQTGTQGITLGEFGTSVKMTRILPGEELNIGDMVITSGQDGLFFPGLGVGRVINVEEDSANVLREATLEPLADYNTLDRVFVISMGAK